MRKISSPLGLPDLAIIITCACWGLNFVMTKSATGSTPDTFRLFVFNIIRFPAASVLLFLTAWFRGERIMFKRNDIAAVGMISFVGIFLYQIFYMSGQNVTSSSNIGIIYGFSPLLILILSILAKIEKPSAFTVYGVILGCLGLFIILFQSGWLSIDIGSFLMFIAVFCWACYAVFGKHILDRYPPIVTTAWMLLFGSLYQLPLAIWQLPDQQWTELSSTSILFVILSTLLSLYLGYSLFYYSVSRLGPAKAGVYTNLTPVFTLFFASLIRNERILLIQILGLTVIFIGIGLTKLKVER